MANPLLVEVVRGPLVESRHTGAICLADGLGKVQLAVGDIERPIFPRSAVKALQAIPLVESGAADSFSFTEEELALACASHSGEPRHVAAARSMLAKAGLAEDDLECGPHAPRRMPDLVALHAGGGSPRRIHNNCSGKHAGMLATARHLGMDVSGYSRSDHPIQQVIRAAMAEMTGADLVAEACAIDGCSVPTWAMPLSALALGFARFATGGGLSEARAAACARLRGAVEAHPFMVAGTDRFCTTLMQATGAAAFVKTGAEGVFCGAFPQRGLGLALKIDDGAGRASEVVMAEAVAALCRLSKPACATVDRLARPTLVNWAGMTVGHIRASEGLRQALRTLG